jgi:hypothetical protein
LKPKLEISDINHYANNYTLILGHTLHAMLIVRIKPPLLPLTAKGFKFFFLHHDASWTVQTHEA